MEDINNLNSSNTLKKLAKYIHDENWSGWMEYMFSKCYAETGQFDKETGGLVIPKDLVERWKRQMNTKYEDLSEKEKQSDIKEALRILEIISESEERK